MNRFANRFAIVVLLQLSVAVAAFGQGWPLPSKTPGVEVTCTACTGSSPPANGKTVGYRTPIASFTGRLLDSQTTNDIQQTFRTARAAKIVLSPDGRRIYILIGGMAGAYDTASFFTRLASGEALMPSTSVPLSVLNSRAGAPEVFLRPDRFFYAEYGGGWTCPFVDGQTRLDDFDVDDLGYLYLSHAVFNWGIVKDDLRTDGNLTLMQSQYQHWPFGDNGDQDPAHILSFKSGTQYFALINVTTQSEVWNVTDRSNPVRVVTLRSLNFSQAAKNATGDRIALMDGSAGNVTIYSAASLAVGGTPMATFSVGFPYSYASVASDGINFFGAFTKPTLKIAVFTPSGSSFVQQSTFDTGVFVDGAAIRTNAGYLTVITPNGLLLYKITSSLGFTEIPLKSSYTGTDVRTDSYFSQYYFNFAPSGYGYPHFYVHSTDAAVIKSGGKTYLVYTAGGLADVYELQNGDGIFLTQSAPGTPNPNTPASERSKVFYADPIGITATTTAPAPMSIQWDFGNPEAVAGADSNTLTNQTGPQVVTHRYSGIGSAAGLTPRNVRVTNLSDSTIFATNTVTMLAPVPRIGLTNYVSLFTQTVANSTAPIVAGDKWFDASDGTIESHTSSWSLWNAATPSGTPATASLSPAQQQDVGLCGPHYVSFTGHYGQNGALLPSTDYAIPTGGLGVGYTVRPFAALVSISSTPTTVTFSNATKLTTDTTVLTPAILAGMQYSWTLLNGDGSVAQAGPTGAYSAIAPWSLSKLSLVRGMSVRLTITSADFTGSCAGLNSSKYTTVPLNAPDPVVNGGCTNGELPCTFTVASASGADMVADGWTYQWSVPGTSPLLVGTGSSFTAPFTVSGTYTPTVIATNNFGSAPASKQVSVVVRLCTPYLPNVNVFIAYSGPNSSCAAASGACTTNEAIQFRVDTFGYDLGCGPHTYAWTFGDGATATGPTAAHPYASGGLYTATCTITDSSNGDAHTLTQAVNVQGIIHVDPCAPGMNSANVFITYATSSGSCSNTGGSCNPGESIGFQANAFGYNFGCGGHSFSWSFGDGATGSAQTLAHTYATADTYRVSLTIVGPSSSIVLSASVKVGSTTICQPPMTANTNVFITYANTDSSCSETGGTCKTGQVLTFRASSFGYDFACANHNFSWSFGDGGTGSGQQVTHTFSGANTYTVSLTIANPGQSVTMTKPVAVTDDVKVIPISSVDFSITPYILSGIVIKNAYVFHPTSVPAGGVTQWGWDFGDGKTETSAGDITHAYPDTTNYRITLTVKAPAGTAATAIHPLANVPARRRSAPH